MASQGFVCEYVSERSDQVIAVRYSIDGTERLFSYCLIAGCEILPHVFSDSSSDQPDSEEFSLHHPPNRYISILHSIDRCGDQIDVFIKSALNEGLWVTITQYFGFCSTTVKNKALIIINITIILMSRDYDMVEE